MPAFQDAVDTGLMYLELDVWCTGDGEVVVHHDESLLRICGVDGLITSLTSAERVQLDAGYTFTRDGVDFPMRGKGIRIPTLEETLQNFPGCMFVVEVKQQSEAAAEQVVAEVAQAGSLERVLLASQYDAVLRRVRRVAPEIPTNLGVEEVRAFYAWLSAGGQAAYRAPGKALQIPMRQEGRLLVTAEALQAAHAVGLEMHVWTINDAAQVKKLLALGVDGIMSDDPHMLRRLCQ